MSSPARRTLLAAGTALAAALCLVPIPSVAQSADTALVNMPVPLPSAAQVDDAAHTLGSPLNNPVTGATIAPLVIGGDRPPSLETLQASRPGYNPSKGLSGPRGEALHEAALSFGARGGLAARGYALNEILRRYEARLDAAFDFRALVVAVGSGQTLMRPPVVTEAQMAFALGDGGQVARETGRVYEITRQAQLSSAPPNWRAYLVRIWTDPTSPPDDLRPRSNEEVEYWNKWVAEGWAKGERQAVEIFLSDLGRLDRDIIGMARYRVLLRAGLVEQPKVTFANRAVEGGRDKMRVNNRTVTITNQPGLNPNRRKWQGGSPPEMRLPSVQSTQSAVPVLAPAPGGYSGPAPENFSNPLKITP